jgi:glutathione S-transferase
MGLLRGKLIMGLHGYQEQISLAHEQEWELYHNSFSLCSNKLRVCMAELGLPYRDHHVHLIETGCYENVGRDYLAINPAGLLPVLVHDGHPIYESHDEIVYAAMHAGERGRALLPEEPTLRAEVEQWIDCASLGDDPIRGSKKRAGHCVPGLTMPIFATMVSHIATTEILKGLLTHPNKERPMIFLTLKFAGIHHVPKLKPAMKLLSKSREHMGLHLDRLGEQISKHGGPWITGDAFTLADVSWMVILNRLVEADWNELFWGADKRPEVAGYWNRLEARDSYREQVLDKRCEMTRRGIAEVKAAKDADPKLRAVLEGL